MDLRTKYMGMELKNPLVPSASPLSQKLDDIKKMEDAGASAVVMFSIFEEQIHHDAEALDHLLTAGTESFAEALSYFPDLGQYAVGPEGYLELISKASQAVQIPIIGSLNGVSHEGWIDYAKKIQEAGAKAIELNVYYVATNPRMSSSNVEKMYVEVLKAVKAAVTIPVAIKLSPFFSSVAHVARKLDRAGADALVMFNRFYQPDFNLDELSVEPSLVLSASDELRLPLRWIAILHKKVKTSIAATTGIHTGQDMAKCILAGADVAMTTSALLKHGIGHIGTMLGELTAWMEAKEYDSVKQMKGAMSQKKVGNPAAFERANYIKALEAYKPQYSA
ncbi:MAG TPA: dihydroorotate dehydrogenase-like protein [Verrucomicrobia bacterium]|nr:MAG: dihydroorotate dehydrogenase [Lentisphaerae bacterium GWF2_57_35]HBA82847.1 dihydroorotate dehydrogenase-like protein [Verrucomicrobiota bacterium]